MLKYILFLLLILAFTSCDTSVDPNEVTPSSELFPLSIGNYWQYEESFSSMDTSYINNYTSTITKVEEIGGYSWFMIESVKNNFTEKRYLMLENDSVYELQYNWQTPIRSLEYITPSEKQQSFVALLGGDVGIKKTVTKLDTIINTKIGDFKNCLKYESSTLDWTTIEILVFGIGVVERQVIGHSLGGEQTFKRIEKIISAKINKVP
jgi:hypothetical protein